MECADRWLRLTCESLNLRVSAATAALTVGADGTCATAREGISPAAAEGDIAQIERCFSRRLAMGLSRSDVPVGRMSLTEAHSGNPERR